MPEMLGGLLLLLSDTVVLAVLAALGVAAEEHRLLALSLLKTTYAANAVFLLAFFDR